MQWHLTVIFPGHIPLNPRSETLPTVAVSSPKDVKVWEPTEAYIATYCTVCTHYSTLISGIKNKGVCLYVSKWHYFSSLIIFLIYLFFLFIPPLLIDWTQLIWISFDKKHVFSQKQPKFNVIILITVHLRC